MAGRRLDHLFASADLRPVAALYHHAWCDAGLSYHAALKVQLERARPRSPDGARQSDAALR